MDEMIQSGATGSLKSKVVQTNIAAGVTSHSCQVWGMSNPWHLSNPSYLKLSPAASSRLIYPDTSHSPDRESLYPENNPSLLSLHPKSAPAPLSFCLSSLYFSLPSPSLSIPSTLLLFMGLLFLSCLHLSLSNHILLFYHAQSPLPLPFSSVHTCLLGISCLCWWESVKRCCDCRLRNSLHFLKDSSAFKNGVLLHWWMLLKLEGLYLRAHLYRWREAPQDHFRMGRKKRKHRHPSLYTHLPKYTLVFGEKREMRDLLIKNIF